MRNESMAALEVLVGAWDVTLTQAWFLDSLETRVPGEGRTWRRDVDLILERVGA